MSLARLVASSLFVFFCVSTVLPAHSRHITVTGKLSHNSTSSAESSGWSINLNPVLQFDGKQFTLVELRTSKARKLENLDEEFVRATGTLIYSANSDTCPVLALSSIKEIKESVKRQ